MKYTLILFLFITLSVSSQTVRWVSVNGSGSGNGTSQSNEWTWAQLEANATCDMIANVRQGNYGSQNHTWSNSCTSGTPLIIRGYKSTAGDIDATTQTLLPVGTRNRRGTTRLANDVEFDFFTTPSSSEMPYFSKSYIRDDITFGITGDYITFENLILNGGSFAMLGSSSSSNISVINCIFREQGDMTISNAHTSNPDRYQGTGISFRGSVNPTVQYCSFLNVEQNAFELNGVNGGTFNNNVIYSYNTINGTDYGFLMGNQSGTGTHDIIMEYNLVYRNSNVPHGMHGIINKAGGNNNIARYSRIRSSNIEVSFASSTGNLYTDIDITGTFQTNGDALAYILVSNGTQGNTFRNITIDGVYGGIAFKDDGEDSSSSFSGYNNDFINITVKNATFGVWVTGTGGDMNTNDFINCNFYNTTYSIRMDNDNSGNRFYNCHFSASSGLVQSTGGHTLNTNTVFQNNHFSGNLSTSSPSAYVDSGSVGGDPLFTSLPVNGSLDISGFMPQAGSPLIDNGIDASTISSYADIDVVGGARGFNGTDDIGMFEYGATTPVTPVDPEEPEEPGATLDDKNTSLIFLGFFMN